MKRKAYGRDAGLTLRMILTTGLLGLLYVAFAVVLFSVLNVGLVPMIVIVVGIAFFQYYTSDKLALLAAGAKVIERSQAPELFDLVERLSAMAELPMPRVAIVDTDVPNAFATGRDPKHAVVAVTAGLMRRLNQQELEAVLAHELTHIKNRDVRTMTLASFFAMLAALVARFALYGGIFGGGNNRDNNGPPIWLILMVVSWVTYAISFVLIRMISRYREYAADRGSALITGAPEYLMSALQKISGDRADSAARPARSRGHERVLHHSRVRQAGGRGAVHGSPAAREASRRARRDRARDGPPGSVRNPFGRRKPSLAAARDRLFALSTAAVTLDMELGLKPAGVAAVIFKPMSAGEFARAASDLEQLLDSVAAETGSKIERKNDKFGFEWLIIRDNDLEDLVTASNLVASELSDAGFAPQLLAAAFRFEGAKGPVYWIYGFKNGRFWPFVPTGDGQNRDNAEELELKAKLEKELPIEPDLTKWLALYDAPI